MAVGIGDVASEAAMWRSIGGAQQLTACGEESIHPGFDMCS